MKNLICSIIGITSILCASPALAHQLKLASDNSKPCVADGSTCQVYCNNGFLAGSMNWNGSLWTDGVKSDPDEETEANKICAANGTECK